MMNRREFIGISSQLGIAATLTGLPTAESQAQPATNARPGGRAGETFPGAGIGDADAYPSDPVEALFATPPAPVIPERSPVFPPIDFRGMVVCPNQPSRYDPPFSDRTGWEAAFSLWKDDGYNQLVWLIDSELFGHGKQFLLRLDAFPEARELTPELVEKNIADVNWLFTRAKQLGFDNYLYATTVNYSDAFAKAHKLTKHPHVRNEITRRYTAANYAEVCRLYPDLDGFYGPMGETLYGLRASWYAEAIVPGLKQSGRNPRYIVHQWQTPLDDFCKHIAAAGVYDNTWLGIHSWNSEQITDPEPYPYVTEWAEKANLPTVITLYPAQTIYFPWNSPRYAWALAQEMKKVPNLKGYFYFDHTGRKLSPLFQKAFAHYSASNEPYSDESWLAILEAQFGDRAAAEHLLRAYVISAPIIPEMCAMVWCGHDNIRRELNIPYTFFNQDWQFTYATSRVRGQPLVPIWHYAKFVARNPALFKDNNGSAIEKNGNAQGSAWRTEGGSTYDVIPPDHMAKIALFGDACLAEADLALKTVKKNHTEAQEARDFMKAYQLLARYYQLKVDAGIAALIHAEDKKPQSRVEAERSADAALEFFVNRTAPFMQEKLDPVMMRLQGVVMGGLHNLSMAKLIEDEKNDRARLAELFHWS